MHFQFPPHAETKIVTCTKGEVFDVAVDIRRGSPTFLNWHGEELSAENNRSLFIPEGFAHGFQTLSSDCEMIYLHSAVYAPEH
jgi:dTDP-4-dehydrorhamnose 3,5-epimerase